MDYFENILNERWLMGNCELNVKQKLYLFVKYGFNEIIAN